MKVIMLAAAPSVHTKKWARGLQALGINVVIVSQHGSRDEADHHLPFSGTLGYFANATRVRHLIAREKPDIVHAHYASGYGTTAQLAGRRPYVLSVWGSDVFEFPERSRFHKALVRRNLRSPAVICATSQALRRQVLEVEPTAADPDITPFGIDIDAFSPNDSKAQSDVITVGTVKSLSSIYGVDVLIDAFAIAAKALPEVPLRLRIVGEGPDRSKLEARARSRQIAHLTEFVGRVRHDEVPGELAKLDIYAALSRDESFGVAVLEASACGLPVVVTSVGGLPEVVRDGETGIIVPPTDAESASFALLNLIQSEQRRRQFGAAGRSFVKANYEARSCFRRMATIYDRYLSQGAP